MCVTCVLCALCAFFGARTHVVWGKEFREDRNLIPKFPNFLNLYNSPIFPNFLNFSNLPKKNKLRPIWVAVIIIYRCMPT